ILNAAYNDQAGVTAAFNLNVLTRINAELATNLDPKHFLHHAFYNTEKGRIEMHLHSRFAQTIYVNDQSFALAANESIHTENSYKYTTTELQALAHEAGWHAKNSWQDEQGLFAVYYFSATD
ncbi:MAG TPA: L-histidine N(alpha)-methyltransferase, partial [Thiothrix sp.]|nr:L-histidine N(alpha)-methyltransferase [Thiothrix sp.]